MDHAHVTQQVIGSAMAVHRALGPGFLESVYHRALAHELTKARVVFASGRPLAVWYDGVVVGEFVADLVVADRVIVEVKGVAHLAAAHEVQLVNYLAATGFDVGLLLNFGGRSLEIRRRTRLPPGRPL